jgi:hypothetical protein
VARAEQAHYELHVRSSLSVPVSGSLDGTGMTYHIRRIKMDDSPNREDIRWVLFKEGKFSQPVAILSDHELDYLIRDVRRQQDNHL